MFQFVKCSANSLMTSDLRALTVEHELSTGVFPHRQRSPWRAPCHSGTVQSVAQQVFPQLRVAKALSGGTSEDDLRGDQDHLWRATAEAANRQAEWATEETRGGQVVVAINFVAPTRITSRSRPRKRSSGIKSSARRACSAGRRPQSVARRLQTRREGRERHHYDQNHRWHQAVPWGVRQSGAGG